MKTYEITKLREMSDAGMTHVLTVTDPQGSFITPDRRYPAERVLCAGTQAECLAEYRALVPEAFPCTTNSPICVNTTPKETAPR